MKFEVELSYSYIVVKTATRIIEAKDESEARDEAMADLGTVEFEHEKTMDNSPIEIECITELES